MKHIETQNINTSKCEKTECLLIEIHKHQSKAYTYIVSNGCEMLGELVEDDIQGFLGGSEMKKFYNSSKRKFLVPVNRLKNIVKPKYY